ncbi:helix-turn-helix transcriptional regulator [Negadavirga shengliensis]|uniref:Helix-turn-helix transcriptional regulator n=1 Tax=Negadavirga shengliensis TaxID=1389218 RepID=A0ABV9T419_9BACT
MNINLPDNEKAIWILKKEGDLPLKEIAQMMEVTVEGARFHLLKLAGEGLVKSENVSKGRGRPQQIWSLTARGHARFPDAHAELTVNMIQMIRETLGEEALESIIKTHEQKGEARYGHALKEEESLAEKVRKLAEIRTKEGYMAEYFEDEQGHLLVENHCPICAAAEACQAFCRSELNIFRSVLGQGVKVKRVEHIIKGARRCAYRISVE